MFVVKIYNGKKTDAALVGQEKERIVVKLSLWIIREHLLQYHPRTSIQSGRMELTGVRILADTPVRTASNLYLARAQEFIDGETNRVICVHKQDWILLETEDMDQVFNEIMDCFDFYNQ